MSCNASASLFALIRRLQQKLPHLSGSQALDQIKERAVLESTTASAVGLAARQVLFDIRGAHEIGGNGSPLQQSCLLFLQGRQGFLA